MKKKIITITLIGLAAGALYIIGKTDDVSPNNYWKMYGKGRW